MSEEKEFPKEGSSHGGTSRCYSVQARCPYSPREINGVIYTSEWRTIPFEKVPQGFGVPSILTSSAAKDFGLLGYEAAQALRWWFHAESKVFSSIETRLVEHMVEYSAKEKAIRPLDVVGCENNPSFGPPKHPGGDES